MDFNVNYPCRNLRGVKTVFSLDDVNEYASKGHVVLFEKIKLNNKLYSTGFIFRDRETGEYTQAESRHFPLQYRGWASLPEEEFEEICPVRSYARKRSLSIDWAAYILPIDPQKGEELYVEDLIEEVLVTEFWSSKIYAVDGVAVWDGTALNFKRELFDSRKCHIVG